MGLWLKQYMKSFLEIFFPYVDRLEVAGCLRDHANKRTSSENYVSSTWHRFPIGPP